MSMPSPLPPASPTPMPEKPLKKENMLINILMNIVIPSLILTKLSDDTALGSVWALILALAFPIGYGCREFVRTRKLNFFSALGLFSVLMTGGFSLLHFPPEYFALKEAAIPGLLGLITLLSIKSRYPLVKTFIYNDTLLLTDKIEQQLSERGQHPQFKRVLNNASYLVAASFFLSSALNYLLAKILLVSAPGTAEFNAELGKMTALSFPVITIPAMLVLAGSMYYLFHQIKLLTGLSFEHIINDSK